MSNIVPFDFDGHRVTVISDESGEPLFVAKEIAAILGYSDAEAMTRRLDEDEKQNRQIVGFGPRGVTVINESGLYSAILASQKTEAGPFKKWVTKEVLPSIRKTGSYTAQTRAPQLPATVSAMLAISKAISKIPGVNAGIAMSLTLDAIERHTGLPTTGLRLALPGAKVEEAKKLNATQVGELMNPRKSGRAVNAALQVLGLQAKDEREGWILTDAGTKHGEMVPFTRHGHSGYQPLWHESVLAVLQSHYDTSTNVVTMAGASA